MEAEPDSGGDESIATTVGEGVGPTAGDGR